MAAGGGRPEDGFEFQNHHRLPIEPHPLREVYLRTTISGTSGASAHCTFSFGIEILYKLLPRFTYRRDIFSSDELKVKKRSVSITYENIDT